LIEGRAHLASFFYKSSGFVNNSLNMTSSCPAEWMFILPDDQCPGKDEHVQKRGAEVHALLFCQDRQICELRKDFSLLFSSSFKDFSAVWPY
jgi:hypothetical protein